jgi:hypothetical protein
MNNENYVTGKEQSKYKYIAEIISLSVLTVKIKNFIKQRSVKSVSLIMYVILSRFYWFNQVKNYICIINFFLIFKIDKN